MDNGHLRAILQRCENMKKSIALFLALYLLVALSPAIYATEYPEVVAPQYNMAESCQGNVTKVSKNSKWALANENGKAITDFQWSALGDTSSSYIPAQKNSLWGYISPSGAVLIPYNYVYAGSFDNGIALVQTEKREYVYINIYGKELFASPFTYSFSPSGGAICGMIDGLYGYCDTEGNMIIEPQFEMGFDFHEGFAAVKHGGKWGFINTYGQYSVKPTYDFVTDFKNGYAICRLNGKYGIINTAGTKISAFSFDYIGDAGDNGWYPAKTGSTSGYINAKGEWQLKTDYDYCYKYTGGVARVFKDGLWGYIDVEGGELIAPSFTDLGEYHHELAPYSLDGLLWGYLKLNYTLASEKPQKEEIIPVSPGSSVTPTPENEPGGSEAQDPVAPIIVNPANDGTLPLDPKTERCISMKINSTLALKGASTVTLATPPVLKDGVTMIPVRSIVELLGGTIAWNAANQRIHIKWNGNNVSMTIGSKICYVNGVPDYLSATPTIIDGSTLVPLRSVSTALNCRVEWVASHQNIYIYY